MSDLALAGYNNNRVKSIDGANAMDYQFLDWAAHNNCAHIPNTETIAAFEEAERILKDPHAKTFHSIAELMADLLSEDDDEI